MELIHEKPRSINIFCKSGRLTVLTRLEQKGVVKSDKSGMAYVYRPILTRANVTKSRLRSLIEQLYDGAAGPLVLQLMREKKFSADEIAELQKLIDQVDRKGKRPKPGS